MSIDDCSPLLSLLAEIAGEVFLNHLLSLRAEIAAIASRSPPAEPRGSNSGPSTQSTGLETEQTQLHAIEPTGGNRGTPSGDADDQGQRRCGSRSCLALAGAPEAMEEQGGMGVTVLYDSIATDPNHDDAGGGDGNTEGLPIGKEHGAPV